MLSRYPLICVILLIVQCVPAQVINFGPQGISYMNYSRTFFRFFFPWINHKQRWTSAIRSRLGIQVHGYIYIYIYIYIQHIYYALYIGMSFFVRGHRLQPPPTPQTTAGHRWPPQKVAAPSNIEHQKDEKKHSTISKYGIPMVSNNR